MTMKKNFFYHRRSNSGKLYQVEFTVAVNSSGQASIEAEFSLSETLKACLPEVYTFVTDAMSEFHLGIAEFPDRVNHGHPTHPVNRGGFYYDVDGKLYRCDKHLSGRWVAPASDLCRILADLKAGADDQYGLSVRAL